MINQWLTPRPNCPHHKIGDRAKVRDVFFLVCDGLKGLPEVVEAVWPQTIVQTCIIHLIRIRSD